MLLYVVHEYLQPLEDSIVEVREAVTIDLLKRPTLKRYHTMPDEMRRSEPFILSDELDAYPEGSLAWDMQCSPTIQRALEGEDILLPYTALLEAFPDLDPTKVDARPMISLKFPNGIRTEVFNEEAARRGWRRRLSTDDKGARYIFPSDWSE